MPGLADRVRAAVAWLRSFVHPVTLETARGDRAPARVVLSRGRKRLDGATVNLSFGTLHTILADVLRRVDVRARAPRSVLLLGLGAGSAVQLLRADHRIAAPIVAVEVDTEVLRLARSHFAIDAWPDLEIVHADAAAFVATDPRTFELVIVDVFVDANVPPALREAPFLDAVHARTAPGGLLLFNVVADHAAGFASLPGLDAALRERFATVRALEVRSNVVFAAERGHV